MIRSCPDPKPVHGALADGVMIKRADEPVTPPGPERLRLVEAIREACLRAALDAYEQAGLSGVCGEGRWELAVDALRSLDLDTALPRDDESATLPAGDAFPITITPVLTVSNATQAVVFYTAAFEAVEIYRNTYPDGRIVAEMAIGDARFRVADEVPGSANLPPPALLSTSVRINLLVADPDRLFERAIARGAVSVAPVANQSFGLRQGRLADPFGHHWLIGRPLPDGSGDWALPWTRPSGGGIHGSSRAEPESRA
ncbi:MAG: VOC family protein [Candidatus Dormiibacterota bacterium]